jgi:hypothetical protein
MILPNFTIKVQLVKASQLNTKISHISNKHHKKNNLEISFLNANNLYPKNIRHDNAIRIGITYKKILKPPIAAVSPYLINASISSVIRKKTKIA